MTVYKFVTMVNSFWIVSKFYPKEPFHSFSKKNLLHFNARGKLLVLNIQLTDQKNAVRAFL